MITRLRAVLYEGAWSGVLEEGNFSTCTVFLFGFVSEDLSTGAGYAVDAGSTMNQRPVLAATPVPLNKLEAERPLIGASELAQIMRVFDWQTTSIGPPESWPKSLRTAVGIMLTSQQPIWIGWGRELVYLYNDPYKSIIGKKHPWALGKPTSIV